MCLLAVYVWSFPSSLNNSHQLNGKVAPYFTVPKPLLSREWPKFSLLSQQLSHTFLWQTSLPLPIPHCLHPPLWRSLIFLQPQACSSPQRPSLSHWGVPSVTAAPSPTVPSHSCRAGSAEKGKCTGERGNPATFPTLTKSPTATCGLVSGV